MSKALTGFYSRRDFVRSGALVAAAVAVSNDVSALVLEALPIRLGLASYTFRNFSRTQLIAFMKQLNVFALMQKMSKTIFRSMPGRNPPHSRTMPQPVSSFTPLEPSILPKMKMRHPVEV